MMLFPFKNVDTECNQREIEEYTTNASADDLPTQMLAVINFIFHFWHQNDPKADKLFIEHFPNDLYNEYLMIEKKQMTIDEYYEIKISLFDVFSFIFRNSNMLLENETQKFIDLFIRFIDKREDMSSYIAHALIDAVIICVSHKPNKIMFIEENCMFNFYCTFIKGREGLAEKFWIMCEELYWADHGKCDTLNINKLNKCIKDIITAFLIKREEELARLLFKVFKMLYHQKLIDVTKFDVNKFYRVTHSIFNDCIGKNNDSLLLFHLPKIWISIYKRPTNVFKITNFNKLTIFAALFSMAISNILKKVISGPGEFKITKNKNQMLNVVYFALVAFPRLSQTSRTLLFNVLIDLHNSFQEYFEKYSIENHPIESQIVIVQYYVKSFVTFDIHISPRDDVVLNSIVERIVKYPSLSIIF
ncbi:hypothetical protein RF11_07423 [Thelohanellus kitauei]|uniref:Uncharacterized protein n=1 Tax=Thelohanellus kitauei TaxID=669202 RepID=A0A0C2N5J1_THEKT|nr:hypothetical protein RF11_07423 [Thelohanellus kitauei]